MLGFPSYVHKKKMEKRIASDGKAYAKEDWKQECGEWDKSPKANSKNEELLREAALLRPQIAESKQANQDLQILVEQQGEPPTTLPVVQDPLEDDCIDDMGIILKERVSLPPCCGASSSREAPVQEPTSAVETFLIECGLGAHAPAFRANGVDCMAALLEVRHGRLEVLGLPLGHQLILFRHLKQMIAKQRSEFLYELLDDFCPSGWGLSGDDPIDFLQDMNIPSEGSKGRIPDDTDRIQYGTSIIESPVHLDDDDDWYATLVVGQPV